MCPVALMVVGMVATVVSGVVQAVGASQQAKYQAQVAQDNAVRAEQDAQSAIERGRAEEVRRRILVAQEIGKQRAQFAAQGLVLGGDGDMSLSSDLVMADTAMSGEWEALALRWQSSELARRYRLQAEDYRNRSRFHKQAGVMSTIGIGISTAGSVLMQGSRLGGLGSSTPSTSIAGGPSTGVNTSNIYSAVNNSFDVRRFAPSLYPSP